MIIVMSQRKGGSGKSTVAINLTAALLGRGLTVGLLDTDEQRSTYKWFKRREKAAQELPLPECYYSQGDVNDNVRALAKRNQILIVDTAGFHSHELRIALLHADIVITPFRPKPYDLEVAKSQMAILDEVRIVNKKMIGYALINSAPTNAKDTRADAAAAFLSNHKYKVLRSRLSNREAYGDSGQEGLGVTEYRQDQSAIKAAQEITNLVEELLNA
jgi:chromosome partitioning protein